MTSLRGKLLISGGSLYDPNFRHTVVLVGDHSSEGAVGVVLNRALEVSVAEAAPSLSPYVPAGSVLYEGGPVDPAQPVLLAEMSDPGQADVLAFGSIGFLVGDVTRSVSRAILRARVYAGYSGWAPGQLEAEIEEGSWIIEPARVEDVFTTNPELLWSRVLGRLGPAYHRLSRMPFDPSMN